MRLYLSENKKARMIHVTRIDIDSKNSLLHLYTTQSIIFDSKVINIIISSCG